MIDFHKAPSSSRPKTNSLLLQVILRSMGAALDTPAKKLEDVFERVFAFPIKTVNYNDSIYSNSWCAYQTTRLPAPMMPTIDTAFWWEIPRPTTVVTEFDNMPVSSGEAYTALRPRELNTQVNDACILWRFYFSVITGNAIASRSQYLHLPNVFLDSLYTTVRGFNKHAGSGSLTFGWCSYPNQVGRLVSIKHTNMLVAALAAVWPGMAISHVVAGYIPVTSSDTLVYTSLNPLHAMRKVYDAGKEMYGMSALNKQMSDEEYQLLCCWVLLSCILEQINLAQGGLAVYGSEQSGVASTSAATKKAITRIQSIVRVAVTEFEAKAGQLVCYKPTTFHLE